MMPDLAVELLMPPLMEKVTQIAPNVTIDVGGGDRRSSPPNSPAQSTS